MAGHSAVGKEGADSALGHRGPGGRWSRLGSWVQWWPGMVGESPHLPWLPQMLLIQQHMVPPPLYLKSGIAGHPCHPSRPEPDA